MFSTTAKHCWHSGFPCVLCINVLRVSEGDSRPARGSLLGCSSIVKACDQPSASCSGRLIAAWDWVHTVHLCPVNALRACACTCVLGCVTPSIIETTSQCSLSYITSPQCGCVCGGWWWWWLGLCVCMCVCLGGWVPKVLLSNGNGWDGLHASREGSVSKRARCVVCCAPSAVRTAVPMYCGLSLGAALGTPCRSACWRN